MNILIYILSGLVAGIIIGLVIKNRQKIAAASCCAPERGIVKEQSAEKEKNIAKLREYIQDKDKISNEEIQKLLDVSDATAARYFNELEKEGLIKQVGDIGQGVYYQVLNNR